MVQQGSWARTKEAWGFRCAYCLKRTKKLTRDHLIPKSKGGLSTPDNLVPACEQCNQQKMDKPIWTMINADITIQR